MVRLNRKHGPEWTLDGMPRYQRAWIKFGGTDYWAAIARKKWGAKLINRINSWMVSRRPEKPENQHIDYDWNVTWDEYKYDKSRSTFDAVADHLGRGHMPYPVTAERANKKYKAYISLKIPTNPVKTEDSLR